MTEDSTFFFLYRKFSETSFYSKNSEMVHLWIELLRRATYKKKNYLFNGDEISLSPGQFICSRKSVADKTGIHESKVQRYLKKFEKFGMIDQEQSNTSRLITITKWEVYQKDKDDDKVKGSPEEKPQFQPKLNDRMEKFKDELRKFKDTYSYDHLMSFYNHWSEPTQNGKNMLFEVQRSWCTSRRLSKWVPNRYHNNPQKNVPQVEYGKDRKKQQESDKEALKRVNQAKNNRSK